MPDDLDQIASRTSEDVEIAGMGIALQRFLDLQSQAIHAAPHIRSSDRKPDPHTRGNRDHRRSNTSSTRRSACRIDAAADADTVLAGKINLDRLRDSRWRRGDGILLRRDHHRDQLRSRRDRRHTRVVAIELPPTEYLVRVHVVMPGNH